MAALAAFRGANGKGILVAEILEAVFEVVAGWLSHCACMVCGLSARRRVVGVRHGAEDYIPGSSGSVRVVCRVGGEVEDWKLIP